MPIRYAQDIGSGEIDPVSTTYDEIVRVANFLNEAAKEIAVPPPTTEELKKLYAADIGAGTVDPVEVSFEKFVASYGKVLVSPKEMVEPVSEQLIGVCMDNIEKWYLKYIEDCDEGNVSHFIKNNNKVTIYNINEDFSFPEEFISLGNVNVIEIQGEPSSDDLTQLTRMRNLDEINLKYSEITSFDEIPEDLFEMDDIDIVMPYLDDFERLPYTRGNAVIHLDFKNEKIIFTTKDKIINFPCWKHEGSGYYISVGSIPKGKFDSKYKDDLYKVEGFKSGGSGQYMHDAKGYGNGERYMSIRGDQPTIPDYDQLSSYLD